MFKLLASVFKRLVTAVTNPFRMLIVRVQRLFNVNILTAKLIPPLTKKVKALVTLKPQSPKDYFSVGRYWVYKKLFLTLILALCAGVFLYFSMFAPKVATRPTQPEQVMTSVTFDYDDMDLAEYTGVANIRAADGTVVYVGDVVAGVCTGNGTLKDRKGRLVYEGGFENNQYSGQGIQYWPSGNRSTKAGSRTTSTAAKAFSMGRMARRCSTQAASRMACGTAQERRTVNPACCCMKAILPRTCTTAAAPNTTKAGSLPTPASSSGASPRAKAPCTAARGGLCTPVRCMRAKSITAPWWERPWQILKPPFPRPPASTTTTARAFFCMRRQEW